MGKNIAITTAEAQALVDTWELENEDWDDLAESASPEYVAGCKKLMAIAGIELDEPATETEEDETSTGDESA